MARRELDFVDLDAAVAEVERLHQRGWEKSGQWSLAMACEHLSKATDMTIDGFPFRPALPLRVVGKLIFKPVIFKRRKFKAGIRGPAMMEPHETDEAKAVAEFARAAARFQGHSGRLHPSPFLGTLTKKEWEQFHCIHAAHHLSFLAGK